MGASLAALSCLSDEQVMEYLTVRPPPLDPRRVAAHLDGCSTCRLMMVEAARALSSIERGPLARGESALAPGEVIDERFEITRLVARGGMGEVYQARDLHLQDDVALKTLAVTALDDEAALARFKAEVRLARKVTHPNVSRIMEYGIHRRPVRGGDRPESIPFLTMELLAGETLAERLERRHTLSPDETLAVARQVVGALQAIHAAGVIHRDLKSENVFLEPGANQEERVVVMDFGLARALDGSVISTWPLVPVLAGTLDTMAPEQIEGRQPGPATDVFALGVLLFEMLSGQRPFAGVPALERLRGRPPRLASLRPDLPPAWDKLCDRCLQVDPARRWPDMVAIAGALDAVARPVPGALLRAWRTRLRAPR
jgi:serine/threonine protein kinase